MNFLLSKFRPSSHSEDYTVVAEYATPSQANKVEAILKRLLADMKVHGEDYDSDWDPDEASIDVYGRNVSFEVYTAGYLEHVVSTMKKLKPTKPIEIFQNYQEITIRLTLPKGLTVKTMALVLDSQDINAVRWLTKKCGDPKKIKQDDREQLEWFYQGDEIFYDDTLWMENTEININEKKYWTVG